MSALLGYVNNALNSGTRTVTVPPEIVAQATEEELEEARKLCARNGIKLVLK
jgi:FAD/FMN-containing dehydrogenase